MMKEEVKARLHKRQHQREVHLYRGTLLIRKFTPLGRYRRPMPRVEGGWAISYGRGTPVKQLIQKTFNSNHVLRYLEGKM